MSKYTDWAHEKALADTLYWIEEKLDTLEKKYHFAAFQEFIKDDRKAFLLYQQAAEKGYEPAYYKMGEYLVKGKGCPQDLGEAEQWFKKAVEWLNTTPKTMDLYYRLGMCFRYGWGIQQDDKVAFDIFTIASDNCGKALYEIGLYYLYGSEEIKKNLKLARHFFRKSYDLYTENAIFKDFEAVGEKWDSYEYQREIKEAFSFRLGQFMRIAEVSPCKNSFLQVARLYRKGYPGDTADGYERYQKHANDYEKKAEAFTDTYTEGRFLVFNLKENQI